MSQGIDWRAEDTESELGYRFHHEPAPDLRPRWQALWLLRQGYTRKAVVQALGIHPRTVCDWIAWYQSGGCAEVAWHRLGQDNGHPCRLTIEQQAELAAWAADGTFYTYEDARQWVADTWQVSYSYDGIRSLLNRIGIHPRVPRPLAAQANLAAQEAWKKGGCVRRFVRTTRRALRGWAGVMSSGSGSLAQYAVCSRHAG
jgi:transposase